MCSGCAGDYEGENDGWAAPPANSRDEIHGGLLGRRSIRPAASRARTCGCGRNDIRKQRSPGECQVESTYEVFVSAEEIIEIHRIIGHSGGAS